jgi:uncharacterized repeat protein (TIGR01451 family)
LAVVHSGIGRPNVFRWLGAVLVIAAQALFLAFGPLGAGTAQAAPGSPGSPQQPTQLFLETFENNPVNTPVLLTNYTGTAGMRYTADPAWLANCNGNVVAAQMPLTALPANCRGASGVATQGMANLQSLAYGLGVLQGSPTPATNRALSAYTDRGDNTAVGPGAPGLTQIQTATEITVPPAVGGKRYVTFSVDVSAIQCVRSAPLLQFYLLSNASAIQLPGQINACTDPRGRDVTVPNADPATGGSISVHIGSYAAPNSLAVTGQSLGVRMVNNNPSGDGNDAAVDDLQILDATPQLDKAFSPAVQVAGQPAQLTFTITNTAELASKLGWSFSDALPAGMTVVAPAATTNCTNGVVHAPEGSTSIGVTGDLATNQASCTVTVNVTGTAGHFVNGPGNVTVDGVQPPGSSAIAFTPVITLAKAGVPDDANGNGRIDPGETIAYTFTVTNPTSNGVTLSGVAVDDPRVGPVSCPATPLAAGASALCTATYTVTQPDLDAGVVNNTATATAVSPPGVDNPPAVTASASTPLPASVTMTMQKTVNPTSALVAGDTVTYSFDVTNTGNVTLTGVAVAETVFSGTGTRPVASCPVTTLAPGASTTCTATYTITQADVNAGRVENTAVASGTPPSGPAVSSMPSSAQVIIPPGPAITLQKSVSPTSVAQAGQTVTYSYAVTNTGNVTLTGVTATDTAFSGTGTPPVITCPVTTLAPSASTTCTGTYTVTLADADAGSVTDTAVATGTPPTGPAVTSPESFAVLTIPAGAAITVQKSAAPPSVNAVGDTITYTFVVTNSGNVDLTGVVVTETQFSGSGTPPVATCAATALAPGASTTCTATYIVTQADLDSGSVANSAVASGIPPAGPPPVSSEASTADVTVDQVSALTLTKTAGTPADTNGSGRIDAGDTIAYSFVVTNAGNVTLTHVVVSDEKVGPTTCPTTPLAPQASMICSKTYTITQADVDAGSVVNNATASATPPPSAPQPNEPTASATTGIPALPAITLVKSADRTSFAAGDTIRYTFTATNTGNVTLAGVQVTDVSFSGTGSLSPLACNRVVSTTLIPGQSLVCVATYRVTQADVRAGRLHNVATATGTPPTGPNVTSESTLNIPVAPPKPPTLPVTGAPLWMFWTVAFLLLTVGATLLSVAHVTRRRLG